MQKMVSKEVFIKEVFVVTTPTKIRQNNYLSDAILSLYLTLLIGFKLLHLRYEFNAKKPGVSC